MAATSASNGGRAGTGSWVAGQRDLVSAPPPASAKYMNVSFFDSSASMGVTPEGSEENPLSQLQRRRSPSQLKSSLRPGHPPHGQDAAAADAMARQVSFRHPHADGTANGAPVDDIPVATTFNDDIYISGRTPADPAADGSDSDACDSDNSSLSARSETELLEKHVKSLLNPHATRDFILKCLAATALFILLCVVVVGISDLRATNQRLRDEGARITADITCTAPLAAGRVVSHDWAGYHEGLGMAVGEIFKVQVTQADGVVVGTFPLAPYDAKRTVVVTSHPQEDVIALAVVAEGRNATAAAVALPHTRILAVEAHAEIQATNEWSLLLIYTRAGTDVTLFTTVTVTAAGAATVGTTVAFPQASEGAVATWLRGLPLRYAVATTDNATALTPARYHLLEVRDDGTLVLAASGVSSQVRGGGVLDMLPVPSVKGGAFVVLAKHGVLVVQADAAGSGSSGGTAAAFVEWDVKRVACGGGGVLAEGWGEGAPRGPTATAAGGAFYDGIVAACTAAGDASAVAGGAPQCYSVHLAAEKELVVRALDVPSRHGGTRGRAAHAVVPVSAVGTPEGDIVVVVARGGAGADCAAGMDTCTAGGGAVLAYDAHRVVFRDGAAYVSDAVDVPSMAGDVVAVTPTGVFEVDAVRGGVYYREVAWAGGMRVAGVTLTGCGRGGRATLLLQGLLPTPTLAREASAGAAATPDALVAYPVYPHVRGALTAHRHIASAHRPVGRVVSDAHLYIDVISGH